MTTPEQAPVVKELGLVQRREPGPISQLAPIPGGSARIPALLDDCQDKPFSGQGNCIFHKGRHTQQREEIKKFTCSRSRLRGFGQKLKRHDAEMDFSGNWQ